MAAWRTKGHAFGTGGLIFSFGQGDAGGGGDGQADGLSLTNSEAGRGGGHPHRPHHADPQRIGPRARWGKHVGYCDRPSTAKDRKFAYFSPIF